jgi:hypothetical protein
LAQSYKEDGNFHFKIKKYLVAIASYTEGLKQKADNKELNASLYLNRAAAHFHLGNFRLGPVSNTSYSNILKHHLLQIIIE